MRVKDEEVESVEERDEETPDSDSVGEKMESTGDAREDCCCEGTGKARRAGAPIG